MVGLLLKDYLSLKRQMRFYIIFLVFYSAIAIASGDGGFLGGIIAIFSAMLPVTAMAYDERSGWDKYALTMPISRGHLVLSKYLLGVIVLSMGLGLMILFNLIQGNANGESLLLSFIFFGLGLLFFSLVMPIMFHFGVEKGRTAMLIVLLLPTFLVIVVGKTLGTIAISPQFLEILLYSAPVAIILLLLASVVLSLFIYKRKEL